jgi:Sulfotransferase domain.
MLDRFIAGARVFLGLHHPGRNLDVFDDDVFIVSYPKSGNTWTRFLIANLLHPEEPATFGNINELTPDPEAVSKRQLAQSPRPRVIKSHQYFDPRYKTVLCIVRDPRDVALSQYHFRLKRGVIADGFPIEQFIPEFISAAGSPYGTWGENVGSWLFTRSGTPNFLLMRYEDMLQDTISELSRISAFLHIDADAGRLAQAAERSSAENMRKLEKAQGHLWSTTKETRQDMPFVRSAKFGAWKSELPPDCVAQIEQAWGPIMKYLNYPLSSPQPSKNAEMESLLAHLPAPS